MKKLLITGADGLLGSALVRKGTDFDIIPLTHKTCDLTDFHSTKALFTYFKPDYVIHTAAVVGGIGSNMNHPGRFFNVNININNNVLECAKQVKVEKLISYMSTCVFPDDAPYPLNIKDIHSGPPHPSNAAYAYAKRMLDVQSKAYRDEYGCDFITLVPANLYGPNDNWDIENGHVIPSLIHKAFLARDSGDELKVWGSGKPLREFIYVDDMAEISFKCLLYYNDIDPLIVSPKEEITIKEVATIIHSLVGVGGFISFNTEKPDGQMRKPSDNTRFFELFPDYKFTSITSGLEKTVNWFRERWDSQIESPMRGVSHE